MDKIENLKNYVTLECVYSSVFWFNAGKHYIIKNVTPTTVEIISNYDDTVTFNISELNGKYIAFKPGNKNIDSKTNEYTYSTPSHYQGSIQPIDLINAQDLNFNIGNVVKYVCRAGKKQGENILTDLEKAKDYINFEIERVKKWTNDNAKN